MIIAIAFEIARNEGAENKNIHFFYTADMPNSRANV